MKEPVQKDSDFPIVRLVVLVLLVLVVAIGGCRRGPQFVVGAAEEEEASEAGRPLFTGGLYINWLWLVFAVVTLSIMVTTVPWVDGDTDSLKLNRQLWNALFMQVFILYAVMVFFLPAPMLFAPIGIGIFAGMLSWYVKIRNRLVPSDAQVFTRKHFARLADRWKRKFGIAVQVPAEADVSSETFDLPIFLADGTPYEVTDHEELLTMEAFRNVLGEALAMRASEVYLRFSPQGADRLYRVDGYMFKAPGKFAVDRAAKVAELVKRVAGLGPETPRGRFLVHAPHKPLQLDVLFQQLDQGSRVKLRFVDSTAQPLDLNRLGMSPRQTEQITNLITNSRDGVILVCGPTMSGKTTTAAALLNGIDRYTRMVEMVVPMPEFELSHASRHVASREKDEFPTTLRGVLRQDPEVVFVDGIDDPETAEVALQAATTDHLVIATLEAGGAIQGISTLLGMPMEPHLVSSALSAILSVRLVRILCVTCKRPYRPAEKLIAQLNLPEDRVPVVYAADGCEECQGTGYRGQIGLFEVLLVSDRMRQLIRRKAGIKEMFEVARREGMRATQEEGLARFLQGVTTLAEIKRVTK